LILIRGKNPAIRDATVAAFNRLRTGLLSN
jgi:hypothetical protein